MIRLFFSLRTTAVLLLVIAAVMGGITALEAADTTAGEYRGTYYMYGSWWFATLLGLVFLNLLGMLFTRRLRRRRENLLLHTGLGLVLAGAFLSWRLAERVMVYLSEGDESNMLEVSNRLWIEGETPEGELHRTELHSSKDPHGDLIYPFGVGDHKAELVSFLPHADITHTPRPLPTGGGVPAVRFAIVTPHGEHELFLAGGFQEEAEVAGLRVILAPPGSQPSQQPALLVRTQTEEKVVPLHLPEDVGRIFDVLSFEFEILEYAPAFRVGQPVNLGDPPTNPVLLLAVRQRGGTADTIRVFSRFPGFARPRISGLTDAIFIMSSSPSRRLHVYPDSLQNWRFTFLGESETVSNAVAPGDTFFVGQGARLPMVVKDLLNDAEVVPRVTPSEEGPAVAELLFESSEKPVWLIEDGPDVLVPLEGGGKATFRLVHTMPLPFWIRLDEGRREFYPNSSIPRVFASALRLGTSPKKYDLQQSLKTNAPLSYRGWRIYQSEYGDDQGHSWSGLQLAKDPGAPLTGIGVLALLLGILVRSAKRT